MLLTGAPQPAQAVVLESLAGAADKIHHFRQGKSREAWLVGNVRKLVLNKPLRPAGEAAPEEADALAGPPLELARRFSTLAEPGRSALALLYINRFSLAEIALILQLPVDMLASAIDSARVSLGSGESAPQSAPSPEGLIS